MQETLAILLSSNPVNNQIFWKMKKLLTTLLVGALCICCEKPSNHNSIIQESTNASSTVNLSEILANFRLIPLEKTPAALIFEVRKRVKNDGLFYILNGDKQLLVFDNDGLFVRQISSHGRGPGEYEVISDFDVNDDHIVILDIGKTHFYNKNGGYEKSIPIKFRGYKMKFLPGGNIIFNSSGEEDLLCIMNPDGQEISRYLKRGKRHMIRKMNPFIQIGEKIYFQDGTLANDIWCYDCKSGNDGMIKFVDDPDAVSADQEEEYVASQGFEYAGNTNSRMKVRGMNASKEKGMAITFKNDDVSAHLHIFEVGTGKSIRYEMAPSAQILEDITFSEMPYSLFATFNCAAENNLISVVQPYKIQENLEKNKDKSGNDNYENTKRIIGSLGDVYDANPLYF